MSPCFGEFAFRQISPNTLKDLGKGRIRKKNGKRKGVGTIMSGKRWVSWWTEEEMKDKEEVELEILVVLLLLLLITIINYLLSKLATSRTKSTIHQTHTDTQKP